MKIKEQSWSKLQGKSQSLNILTDVASLIAIAAGSWLAGTHAVCGLSILLAVAAFAVSAVGGEPPAITVQPTSTNVTLGAQVMLRVEASGEEPLAYQWYRNGQSITGKRTNSLSFYLNGPGAAGLYHVTVTNSYGKIESAAVTVSTNLPGNGFALLRRGSVAGFPVGAGSGAPIRIEARGNLAYLVDGWTTNIYVLDIANPDAPQILSTTPVWALGGAYAFGIALVDDYALVAARLKGLVVHDLTKPTQPTEVRSIPLPGIFANSIVVRNRRAYIGNENGGLVILDVDDPANPQLISQWKGLGQANGVALDGDRAFIASWNKGIEIVDVWNPANPTGLGRFPAAGVTYNGTAFGVLALANRLYVADTTRAGAALDVTDPGAPVQVGSIGASAWEVVQIQNYLFVAAYSAFGGLQLSQLGTGGEPELIVGYTGAGRLLGVKFRGNRALLGGTNFTILDVSFPPMLPQITDQPESRRVIAGAKLALEVAVAGAEPFTYQWMRGGQDIAGETGPLLAWQSIQLEDAGEYSVRVTDAGGNVVTSTAGVVEVRAPSIIPTTVRMDGPGRIRFNVRAAFGARFAVMRSADLDQWSEAQVLTASGRETPFEDAASGGGSQFYRVELR